MDSIRSFIGLWAAFVVLVLSYAVFDLRMHPWLQQEHAISMHPDLSRVGELWHWGGRLVREGAVGLLVCNAIVLGGLFTLAVSGLVRLLRRQAEALPTRVSSPPH